MTSQATFWYVTIRDASGKPVACACLSGFTVDPFVIAGGKLKKAASYFRRIFPRFLSFKIMSCGLPVSTGHSSLRFAPDADPALVLKLLDGVLQSLARNSGARLLLFKEFEDSDCEMVASLARLGYIQAESLLMNSFTPVFTDFELYLSSLKAHYRQDIRRSQAKLERSGFTIKTVKGGAWLEQLYTEDVHRLYLAVVDRAVNKLEVLPREFFLALARQFPESVSFTYISRENRIAAFNWAFHDEHTYQLLFCGLDYELNKQAELYFNLMYAELDNALKADVANIHFGQTANAFKSRLGCSQSALWIYLRPMIVPRVIKKCSRFLFPRQEREVIHNIYKSATPPRC
jgi:predicted N-acyltransferase